MEKTRTNLLYLVTIEFGLFQCCHFVWLKADDAQYAVRIRIPSHRRQLFKYYPNSKWKRKSCSFRFLLFHSVLSFKTLIKSFFNPRCKINVNLHNPTNYYKYNYFILVHYSTNVLHLQIT